MGIEEYIKDIEVCVEKAKNNKDQHSYDTYYGMLCGAKQVYNLVKSGYTK